MTEARYTPREELVSGVTHGVGAALGAVGMAALATLAARRGDARLIVSVSVYGASLTLLFLCSTLYHLATAPRAKSLLRVFDHSAIFLLIAGTYTPFTLVALKGAWGWTLFGLVWGFAAVGILHEVLFMDRFPRVTIALYLGMGWLIVIAIKPLLASVPRGGMAWLVGGGLAYTAGVAFYANRRIPFHHAIWHLFVLGGAACHFCGIFFYLLPAAAA
jgi:hemolysin III